MAGMTEVGRLFNNNELIVAEVLQSAEAMKAAVNHLQQFMEKADTATRGNIVLATVKGDVHDIGKNLVEIILANNGYQVINLGIKVPSDDLIQAWREHHPDAIGLSGPAGQERAPDGHHGAGFQGSRRRGAPAGGRRGAVRKIHDHAHRPGLWRADLLRQGRHDRARHHEPVDGPCAARCRARVTCLHSGRRSGAGVRARRARRRRTQPQSPHRYSDSAGSLSRPPRSRSPQPSAGLELHQSVHAVRPSSRL